MAHTARPYQQRGIDALRDGFRRGLKRQVLIAPTGAGKTTIAAIMIESAMSRGRSVDFFAHRRELIEQCSARLSDHGIKHGVYKSGHHLLRPNLPVQVASIQTIGARLDTIEKRRRSPDIIFIDECHRAKGATYGKMLDVYPDAVVVGLTATPWRLDGKPLGDLFEDTVVVATPQRLIDDGFLLAPRVYATHTPDLTGVKKEGGDFAKGALGARMEGATIVGDLVKHYRDKIGNTSHPCALAFAVNVKHSETIASRFVEAGIPAAHVDGNTPASRRAEILEDLRIGTLKVVSNCELLTEGYDLPALGGVLLARPTMSLSLYLQMCGRVMRPDKSSGKSACIILDHAGNVFRHGFPQDERDYSLESGGVNKRKEKDEDDPGAITVCRECFASFKSKERVCPECGWEAPVKTRKIEEDRSAELREWTPDELKQQAFERAKKVPWATRRQELVDLYLESDVNGLGEGWVKYKYRSRYDLSPPRKMLAEAQEIIADRRAEGIVMKGTENGFNFGIEQASS